MSAETTLGAHLRRLREQAGISVDAVSAGSRIVPQHIRALEADRHELLPAPVYVRGFIRAYCEQVGADPQVPLARYDAYVATLAPPSLRPAPATPTPAGDSTPAAMPSRRRIALAAALLLTAAVAAALLVARSRQGQEAEVPGSSASPAEPGRAAPMSETGAPTSATGPPPASPSDRSEASDPSAMAAPPAAPAPSAPAASAAPAPAERVLVIRAIEETWVRVVPEGAPAAEDTLEAGEVRQWRSGSRFRVTLGNAGGVELELDGRPWRVSGTRGQVVHATIPEEPRP